jgi:hypothetical protein
MQRVAGNSKHKQAQQQLDQDSSISSLGHFAVSMHGSMHGSMHSRGGNAIPDLYRFARRGQWQDFIQILPEASDEEITYVYKKDGTTALHLAVMSRTGYIDSFKNNNSSSMLNFDAEDTCIAPLHVVHDLLEKAPQLAKIKCTLNGYTPLTYACLVCNEEYNTDDAANMVRLFLRYCPESIRIFSDDSLSPVDIHIVSYSHHHKEKEEESTRGRTSTAVLRTLLNHSPDLANLRLANSRDVGGSGNRDGKIVDGPLELLYKCNARAFSKATLNEVYDSDDDGTIASNYTLPEKRQQVVDEVKTWWIWTWAVLLLKYGSKANKKRGTRFAAVHTASLQVGVPTPLLSICLYAFPRQIKLPIEDNVDLGNLPLHAICSWPCHHDNLSGGVGEARVSTRKSMAINRVLEEYPLAVKVKNNLGESPLELALKAGTTWDGGVRRLVKANPKALKEQSPTTGLYPFMTAAAVAADIDEKSKSLESSLAIRTQELLATRTIYGLLRSNPNVLDAGLSKSQQTN